MDEGMVAVRRRPLARVGARASAGPRCRVLPSLGILTGWLASVEKGVDSQGQMASRSYLSAMVMVHRLSVITLKRSSGNPCGGLVTQAQEFGLVPSVETSATSSFARRSAI